MPRVSPPTHDHLHHPDRIGETSAIRYLEDNLYRKNILKHSDWTELYSNDISSEVYDATTNNGGITIDLNGQQPTEGYAIAIPQAEQVVPLEQFTPEIISQYIENQINWLSEPGYYLGTWINEGQVYVDISKVEEDLETAYQTGQANNQKAIYNLTDGQEIPIEDGAVKTAAIEGFQGSPELQQLANEYNQSKGLGQHPQDYVPVDPNKAAQVAAAYDQLEHNPNDPQVRAAYDALINETKAQYDHLVNNGYKFEFYPQGQDPYPNSPREAVADLHNNRHLYVYPTAEGFGMDENPQDHPLLKQTEYNWNGQPVYANDLFRGVHDAYGHAKEGFGFRADGEDNAYRQHAAMFTPLAQKALANETRSQNSYVNYGPYGQQNQTATQADTVYAPQKAGIAPDWVVDPNLHAQPQTQQTFSAVEYPSTHSCPNCDHPLYAAGHKGFTDANAESKGNQSWSCPNCNLDFKDVENRPVTSSIKTSLELPWGQDWQEWQDTKPNYTGGDSGHKLGYDPDIHQEGKGFILNNGDVWTWPTQDMRPRHMDYAGQARAYGGVVPGSAFHLGPQGKVWQYGEGRNLSKDQQHAIRNADPRLDPWSFFNKPQESPEVQTDGYGHAERLMNLGCVLCADRPYSACPGCLKVRVAAMPDWDYDNDDWETGLDDYLNNYEIYPWQRGNSGKFFVTPQGEFTHWQTNDYGEPHHDSVASEWNKQQALKGEIAPNGAWWITDTYHPNPAQLINKATPQAQKAGLNPSVRGYIAKKSDICPDCMKPFNECTCEGAWVDQYQPDQLRDLKPEFGGTS